MPKYEIFDRRSGNLLAEGAVKERDGKHVIECLIPNSPDVVVFIDGKMMQMFPAARPPQPKTVDTDQIVEAYWTYGESYTRLRDKEEGEEADIWQTKYYEDLNLHVVTEEGNDGKVVKIVLEDKDKRKIRLRKIISENNVVFDKVFGNNI
ncbi:MAG: hypothetical protein LBU83_13960 [Bacteroidales bacterium]|jgi:hypothetical protein|nr:hypothetical protein [Bacteroidales bacterium]